MKSALTHMTNFTISVNAGIEHIELKTNNKTKPMGTRDTFNLGIFEMLQLICSLLLAYLQRDWILIRICWNKLSIGNLHQLLSVSFQLRTFDSKHRNPVNKLA